MKLPALLVLFVSATLLIACSARDDKSRLDRQATVRAQMEGRKLEPPEGIWRSLRGDYEIAFYRSKGESETRGRYVGVPLRLPALGAPIGREAIWIDPGPQKNVFIGNAAFGLGRNTGVSLIFTAPHHFWFAFQAVGVPHTVSMVRIWPKQAPAEAGAASSRAGSGSGFLVANGLAATNAHVVQEFPEVKVTIDGRRLKAQVLRRDPANDLALIRVRGEVPPHACLDLAQGSEIVSGERIYALGFPLSDVLSSREARITEGLINAVDGGDDDPTTFQMSAPIQPGSSGGPVVNAVGALVGISVSGLNDRTFLRAGGFVPQNVNFAVKRAYLELLLKGVDAPPCSRLLRPLARPMEPSDLVRRLAPAVVHIEAGLE
ncbi:MAG: trypsin-like peptidase domain-containing protein [Alphaproteobacteria bacterium]|nr:trypsin-like peptidase domain-containing protein [Alphaproteobacteria bacterium]